MLDNTPSPLKKILKVFAYITAPLWLPVYCMGWLINEALKEVLA